MKGILTDHAADQKLLHKLFKEWKEHLDKPKQGDEAVLDGEVDFVSMMLEALKVKVEEVGGQEKLDALLDEKKAIFNKKIDIEVWKALGDMAFNALSDKEKWEVNFLVWTGCCMHKEMNAVKGGSAMMQAYWESVGVVPPKLLKNKDNPAAGWLHG